MCNMQNARPLVSFENSGYPSGHVTLSTESVINTSYAHDRDSSRIKSISHP